MPVLGRLSERFDGQDVTKSAELAERAAQEFDRDQRLQELLRSGLVDALDPVVKGQERVEADIQTLCVVAMENSQALGKIGTDIGAISDRLGKLETGVSLNDEAVETVVSALAARQKTMLEVRQFASEQLESVPPKPLPWLSGDEIYESARTAQVGAVALLREGKADAAAAQLREAQMLLARALLETPTDLMLKLQEGYVFKTQAQVAAETDSREDAERYLTLAENAFRLVLDDVPSDQRSIEETASAINGLGNVYSLLGRLDEARRAYERATSLAPDYAYAWHDLFVAHDALAREGSLDLDGMRQAYAELRRTGPGYPKLDPPYLNQLGEILRHWEAAGDSPDVGDHPQG